MSVEVGYVSIALDWTPMFNTLNVLIVLAFTTVVVYIIAKEMGRS